MSGKQEFEPIVPLDRKQLESFARVSSIIALGLVAYYFTFGRAKPSIKPTDLPSTPVSQPSIRPTAPSAFMGENTWVTVRNSVTIESGNNTFNLGDSCLIKNGARITKIGEDPETSKLLVQYNAAGPNFGSLCADKTEFLMDPGNFVHTTADFTRRLQQQINEVLLVNNLLSKYSPGKAALTKIVSNWEWVDLTPSIIFGSSSCGIKAGNTIQLIGEDTANNRVLARYKSQETTSGTECREGTIFFTTPDKFRSPKSKYEDESSLRNQTREQVRLVINQRGR